MCGLLVCFCFPCESLLPQPSVCAVGERTCVFACICAHFLRCSIVYCICRHAHVVDDTMSCRCCVRSGKSSVRKSVAIDVLLVTRDGSAVEYPVLAVVAVRSLSPSSHCCGSFAEARGLCFMHVVRTMCALLLDLLTCPRRICILVWG